MENNMTPYTKESVVVELIREGYKAKISTTGWLLISGRRVEWKEGWNLAFLGTPIGKKPRIVRTFYSEAA